VITPQELRALPLFDKVSEAELQQLIDLGSEVPFAPGDDLWVQNLPASCWWVLLEGRIDLVRTVGHEETVLGAMDAPGRWAGGFRAWDEHAVYLATGRAAAPGRVLRVAADRLKDWTTAWDPFGAHLIEGVFRTARTVESAARQRDALVALGTLAAGLAHELNNPAAAATRAVDALGDASARLVSSVAGLAAGSVSAEQLGALDGLRAELASAGTPALDPMVLATARTSCRTGSPTTTSRTTGSSHRRWPPRGRTSSGASGPRRRWTARSARAWPGWRAP
jgi:signal transduction histidine kinase